MIRANIRRVSDGDPQSPDGISRTGVLAGEGDRTEKRRLVPKVIAKPSVTAVASAVPSRGKAKKMTETERVACSKALTRVLRHDAGKWKLASLGADGYVKLDELLVVVPYLRTFTYENVEEVVRSCEKQRFSMETRGDVMYIRANQGHTMKRIDDAALLTKVMSPEDVPVCIHGTYKKCRAPIERDGLSVMKRNHIHFAVGLPGEGGVISGMRSSSEVICKVDIAKAMADGIEFFRSENDVILTRGIHNSGILPPTYFTTYSVEEYAASVSMAAEFRHDADRRMIGSASRNTLSRAGKRKK